MSDWYCRFNQDCRFQIQIVFLLFTYPCRHRNDVFATFLSFSPCSLPFSLMDEFMYYLNFPLCLCDNRLSHSRYTPRNEKIRIKLRHRVFLVLFLIRFIISLLCVCVCARTRARVFSVIIRICCIIEPQRQFLSQIDSHMHSRTHLTQYQNKDVPGLGAQCRV